MLLWCQCQKCGKPCASGSLCLDCNRDMYAQVRKQSELGQDIYLGLEKMTQRDCVLQMWNGSEWKASAISSNMEYLMSILLDEKATNAYRIIDHGGRQIAQNWHSPQNSNMAEKSERFWIAVAINDCPYPRYSNKDSAKKEARKLAHTCGGKYAVMEAVCVTGFEELDLGFTFAPVQHKG